ncbi:MAG: hypothetical protein AAGA54_11730 [Myxococcota bacterium]
MTLRHARDRLGRAEHCQNMVYRVVLAALLFGGCSADAQPYASARLHRPVLKVPAGSGVRWARVEADGVVVFDACSARALPAVATGAGEGGLKLVLPPALLLPAAVRVWGRSRCGAPLVSVACVDPARWTGPRDAPRLTLQPTRRCPPPRFDPAAAG